MALGLGVVAFYIWVIADLFRQPDWLWQRARLSKQFWKGLFVFGWLIGVGFPATIVYLAYVRPRLRRAKRSAERGEPWSASDPVAELGSRGYAGVSSTSNCSTDTP